MYGTSIKLIKRFWLVYKKKYTLTYTVKHEN